MMLPFFSVSPILNYACDSLDKKKLSKKKKKKGGLYELYCREKRGRKMKGRERFEKKRKKRRVIQFRRQPSSSLALCPLGRTRGSPLKWGEVSPVGILCVLIFRPGEAA